MYENLFVEAERNRIDIMTMKSDARTLKISFSLTDFYVTSMKDYLINNMPFTQAQNKF